MWTRRKFLGTAASGAAAAVAAAESLAGVSATGVSERTMANARPPQSAIAACRGLLKRQLGPREAEFDLKLIEDDDGRGVYEVSASNGRVTVAGSSGVALSRGIYSYLRHNCNAMITWSGRNLDLPARLPDAAIERVTCPNKFVQYFNPCQFGYVAPFWNWARWEQELDWMALHGVNMPLALEGQEIIWNRVWLSLGLTQAEIDASTTGPAHLPWHRMGNINHLDGPLPRHFMEEKRVLQGKILDRMRAFGMQPIAPAFAGFVPQGFRRLHPDVRTFTELWFPEYFKTIPRSTRTFTLHPGEKEIYLQIGKRFIAEYKAEYGEVDYYLADPFNELDVPVRNDHRAEDLAQYGRTVFESIQAADPKGTWVMQSWLFISKPVFWDNPSVEAFLGGIPNDRMLLIDYANDVTSAFGGLVSPNQWQRRKAFFGKQWMNGMLHTFGGNNNIKGDLSRMATQPASVLASPERGNLVGFAICPEGTENNEVVYELLTDAAWQTEPIDLAVWLPVYCRSRYGACPPALQQAWMLLLKSAYSSHVWLTKQAWQTEPGLHPEAQAVDSGPVFREAVELFLSCAPQLEQKQLYRNDLIELVVQASGGAVDQALSLAVQKGEAKDKDAEARYAAQAVAWMKRMDGLLHLRQDRRLETWVNSARACAQADDEAANYDENSRLLITTWGWTELSDYASRVWSGLTRDYYAARWEEWFAARQAGLPLSLDIWQQTWLSAPYRPSRPVAVANLAAQAHALLAETKDFR